MYSQRERTPDVDGPFTALRKHDEYYLPGGDLFFLIEQNHFRVHRYFFERESPYFKAQLATPASPGASRQGTSESTAIVLNDVRAADFAKFLWVFYNPKYSLYHAKVDDWVAILNLACKWGFTEIKALVVREIERLYMTDIHRVVVYHKYDIDRRLLFANYAALVAREQPLSLEEGMELGMDTTLKIFRAREIARSNPDVGGIRSPRPVALPKGEMKGLIRDLFEITVPEDDEDGEDVAESPVEEKRGPQQQQQQQPQAQPTSKPNGTNNNANTNGTTSTTTTAATNNGTKSGAVNGKDVAASNAASTGANANGHANGNANGLANGNATKGTTESMTTQKNGAGAGAANADAKATANGTPVGVKDSTTTTTAASNTASTPNASTATKSADATKTDSQATDDKSKPTINTTEANKDKDGKESKEETPATPRPETPTGKNANKAANRGKKNAAWGAF